MRLIRSSLALFALFGVACTDNSDPMAAADKQYTQIMVDLAAADRDSTRNIHNREARKRKVAAESARAKFFQSRVAKEAFAAAAESDVPALKDKLAAYRRHKLIAASWTSDEKKEETKLLTRLDELNGIEASWTSADGATEVSLNHGWRRASKQADGLNETDRESLVASFVEHRMRVVGPDLQALVNLRNSVAKRAGFSNYWELGLSSQGLKPADVDGIILELSAIVSPIVVATENRIAAEAEATGLANSFANRMMLRRKIGIENARDESDRFFDTDLAEERVRTAFKDMGITSDGWQVYSGPSRYTRSGVYGFPVRPPASIAIVMSNDQRWTLWQYEAIAHEGGHAVWWQAISDETALSPPMWEPNSPWFEGFAQFFERMVYEPGFHARYVPELPKENRAAISKWRARSVASSIANSIVQTQVERRLYEDPNSLEAITRFASVTRSALTGATAPPQTENGLSYDGSLLSAILWTYPAYSQNYLFSAMTEAWMWDAIESQIGNPIGNPKVGELLKTQIIRANQNIPAALNAMKPGDRSDALKRYFKQIDSITP
jgi:hypothetical protein